MQLRVDEKIDPLAVIQYVNMVPLFLAYHNFIKKARDSFFGIFSEILCTVPKPEGDN
jgi:hypothetical protein